MTLFCSFAEINLSDDDFLLAISRLFAFHVIRKTAGKYHCPATLNDATSLDQSRTGPYTDRVIEFVRCRFNECEHLAYLDGGLSNFVG